MFRTVGQVAAPSVKSVVSDCILLFSGICSVGEFFGVACGHGDCPCLY